MLRRKQSQPVYASKCCQCIELNFGGVTTYVLYQTHRLSDLITTKANNNQSQCIFFIISAVLQGFYNESLQLTLKETTQTNENISKYKKNLK